MRRRLNGGECKGRCPDGLVETRLCAIENHPNIIITLGHCEVVYETVDAPRSQIVLLDEFL
jgi:hypothetical protein